MIRKLQMMAAWISPNVKDRLNEERNDAKVSRSVLESSGSRKGVADFNRCPVDRCPLICHLPELKEKPNRFTQQASLKQLKIDRPWYKNVHSQVLQEVPKKVEIAFDKWIKCDSFSDQ